jgi:hypothetical protein
MMREIFLCFTIGLTQIFLGSLILLGFQQIIPARWLKPLEDVLQRILRLWIPLFILFLALFFTQDKSSWVLFKLILDFIVWGILILLLKKRLPGAGPITLIAILLFGTQLGMDWVFSLNPHWKSTGFGLIFLTSAILMALSLAGAQRPRDFSELELSDIGNVHFSLITTWAYLGFMQLLVIWSGNLPEEATWYIPRLNTSWRFLFFFFVIFQVLLPLFLLLMRRLKRSAKFIHKISLWSFFSQSLFTIFMIIPSLHPQGVDVAGSSLATLSLLVIAIVLLARERNYGTATRS